MRPIASTRRTLTSLAAIALAAALAGCAGSDEDPSGPRPPAPSFSASVTGALTRQLAGPAHFRADLPASDIGTAFALAHGREVGAPHRMYMFRWSNAPLAARDYPIVANDEFASRLDFIAGFGLDLGTNDPWSCFADAGTLRVTVSSPERVAGVFSYTGRCLRASAPGTHVPIAVSGQFDAAPGTFGPGPEYE